MTTMLEIQRRLLALGYKLLNYGMAGNETDCGATRISDSQGTSI